MEKKIRIVQEYNRTHLNKHKVHPIKVRSYKQRYDKPRGAVGAVYEEHKVRTQWLMDSRGRFIGKANAQGETTANKSKIRRHGMDSSGVVREGKYKRILGRTPSNR